MPDFTCSDCLWGDHYLGDIAEFSQDTGYCYISGEFTGVDHYCEFWEKKRRIKIVEERDET